MSDLPPENVHESSREALWTRETALMAGSIAFGVAAGWAGSATYEHSQELLELTPGNTSPLGLAILGTMALGTAAITMGLAVVRGRR